MASEDGSDFYKVLGLNNKCSSLELRNAYKKLALKWHPDRCAASGNSKFAEEAKKKFQAIQEAYSVLSDEHKRFMYDVGVYNKDDDDENEDMGDFLGEMMTMMNQENTCADGQQSFEDLQNLFQEMVQNDKEFYDPTPQNSSIYNASNNTFSFSYNENLNSASNNTFSFSYNENLNSSNKKSCSSMSSENTKVDFNMESLDFRGFSIGLEGGTSFQNSKGRGVTGRRTGRKKKEPSCNDMSSHDAKILA
ncbi:Chaperone dnaj-domain superfamily protein [Thalictrum thalictroides]|uniref:Chaperone dnaj-domain superfamily protein n=1 Tax=Thalictrum thalictroides TaxID=46969 RepID=A0A7J6XCG7_THATH|nr:Chaperone dnaj-domain superfamily protein [Thalictrum thalictroides]